MKAPSSPYRLCPRLPNAGGKILFAAENRANPKEPPYKDDAGNARTAPARPCKSRTGYAPDASGWRSLHEENGKAGVGRRTIRAVGAWSGYDRPMKGTVKSRERPTGRRRPGPATSPKGSKAPWARGSGTGPDKPPAPGPVPGRIPASPSAAPSREADRR